MNELKELGVKLMYIRERAAKAGKVAEEIEHIVGIFNSFRDCRNIQLGWVTDQGGVAQKLHIGKPGIEWPNAELYQGIHDAVLEHLRRRRDALELELKELMNGGSGDQRNTEG